MTSIPLNESAKLIDRLLKLRHFEACSCLLDHIDSSPIILSKYLFHTPLQLFKRLMRISDKHIPFGIAFCLAAENNNIQVAIYILKVKLQRNFQNEFSSNDHKENQVSH